MVVQRLAGAGGAVDCSRMSDQRFAFGANWARFLERLTEDRIRDAERALTEWLGDLTGHTFLDIGSGSGIHSLAARNLGARVVSFDYDAEAVECTAELRRRYRPADTDWSISQGDALDPDYLRSLGQFSIVYSWGVLHHTGDMWKAMEMIQQTVAPSGRLFLALYHRQSPVRHRLITAAKRRYATGGQLTRSLLIVQRAASTLALETLAALANRQSPLARIRSYGARSRGMSFRTDLVDWVGGYPYEATIPDEVFDFYRTRGWQLNRLRTAVGVGCDEYLFHR